MRIITSKTFLGLLSIMMLALSCKNDKADISQQIKDLNKKLMEAFAVGDTTTMATMYTADAKLFPANSEIVDGKNSIMNFWHLTIKMGIKKLSFETKTVENHGDIAIEEGIFSLFAEADKLVDQGKYMVTWKLENGNWKVYRDIWNASTPDVIPSRANVNDNVMVVLNHVKSDKISQFEYFYKNYLATAGAEINPEAKATVRTFKPLGDNEDGTFTYIFLMDPMVKNYDYDIFNTLSKKYGAEKANEYLRMYLACLKEGESEFYSLSQTDW